MNLEVQVGEGEQILGWPPQSENSVGNSALFKDPGSWSGRSWCCRLHWKAVRLVSALKTVIADHLQTLSNDPHTVHVVKMAMPFIRLADCLDCNSLAVSKERLTSPEVASLWNGWKNVRGVGPLKGLLEAFLLVMLWTSLQWTLLLLSVLCLQGCALNVGI